MFPSFRASVVLILFFTIMCAPRSVKAQYKVDVDRRTIVLDDSVFLDCMRRDTFTLSPERDTLLRRLLRNAYFINPFFKNVWPYIRYARHYHQATSDQFKREFKQYLARTYGYQKPVTPMRVVQDITKDDWQATDEDRAVWLTRILNGYKIYLIRQIPNLPPEELREHLRIYATAPKMTLHSSRMLFFAKRVDL